MITRKLRELEVSSIGMGCMGFTHAYGNAPTESEGIQLVHKAFDIGCNFFDTAEMYSITGNETFVGKALEDLPRDKVIISDKFWPVPLPDHPCPEGKLSEAGIRRALNESLGRLKTDYIDIYTLHQMDDEHLEQVAEIMGGLIKDGKIRSWGLSSPTADQIKRAHSITPLTAIQSEYSMMERKWEKEIIPLCQELGIGFVAFSPLGNGFLSGKYNTNSSFEENDLRSVITRFDKENMSANQPLLDLVQTYAKQKNCTSAQIGLAWILAGNEHIVPIPGMRSLDRIRENLGASEVNLNTEEYNTINQVLDKLMIHGSRDGKDIKKLTTIPNSVH